MELKESECTEFPLCYNAHTKRTNTEKCFAVGRLNNQGNSVLVESNYGTMVNCYFNGWSTSVSTIVGSIAMMFTWFGSPLTDACQFAVNLRKSVHVAPSMDSKAIIYCLPIPSKSRLH